VWLLDEPTASLDAASEATLGWIMQRHLAEGGLVVAASHLALPVPAAAHLRLGAESSVAV
jgi:heme exporter protein A